MYIRTSRFTPPAGGVPVNTGALKRIFKVVQDIRNTPACTDAIASDLGMVGSELGVPDWNVFGPVLKISRAHAGVTVGWGWQGKAAFLDQIEIEVDRGGGQGWVLLAIDTTPGYVDTETIPAQPTKWQYRAIYRVGDQRVANERRRQRHRRRLKSMGGRDTRVVSRYPAFHPSTFSLLCPTTPAFQPTTRRSTPTMSAPNSTRSTISLPARPSASQRWNRSRTRRPALAMRAPMAC